MVRVCGGQKREWRREGNGCGERERDGCGEGGVRDMVEWG